LDGVGVVWVGLGSCLVGTVVCWVSLDGVGVGWVSLGSWFDVLGSWFDVLGSWASSWVGIWLGSI